MRQLILFLTLTSFIYGTSIIKEEFNNREELTQNWWVSTWGHAPKQYADSNVTVENGILKLTMVPDTVDGAPRPNCGEITYTTQKFLYGSFRASIKTTDQSGGVVGWFVYKDGVPGDGNLHEVDIEFLTENLAQIHFTLHHDAYGVEHQIIPISFDPSAAFHEYRFDWYKDSVVYFIDSTRLTSLTTKVPDDSCSVMLNYWSNNNSNWGGPMPTTTTHMWVDYMHYLPLDKISPITQKKNEIRQKPLKIIQNQSNLSFEFEQKGEYTIELYTLSGKQLIQKSISGTTGALSTKEFRNQVVIVAVSFQGQRTHQATLRLL